MPSLALTDCKVWLAGYDLSGQLNQAALDYAAEPLDATTFGQTTRINAAGLLTVNATVEGLWDSSSATAPDPVIQARIGQVDNPTVIAPQGATVGNVAYLFRTLGAKYSPSGTVGNLLKFSVSLPGSGGHPLVRGRLMHTGSASGDVTGADVVLGAVGSTQYLYAALHVMSGTGDFTVKVQSDDNADFTSATDRITFTQVGTATAVASEWPTRVAGAITDTHWRIVATNPSTRNFVVAVGIL